MFRLVGALLILWLAAPVAAQTAEQWREDLRFMAAEMEKRHTDLYHSVSRADFAAAVAALDASIPQLERHEIIVGMMRLAASVGDGHTNVSPLKDKAFGFRSLPLKLYLFEEGLYVRAAAPEHGALVGARVEAVGGVPVAEAIRRAAELAPRDNEIGPKLYVPIFLAMPPILHALKLAPAPDVAKLTLARAGRRWEVTVPAGAVEASWPPDTDISLVTPPGWVDARAGAALPLWLQAPLDYHRLVELPGGALYVQLNMVTGVPGQTLAQFGERIGERVRAANPRTLVVDLRLNRGGNMELRFPFIRELIKAEDADTRLAVLVGRGSFSATQAIIDDLDRYTDAVLIGEPASSKPNSFGDSYRIVLPNSGITVRTSLLWHQLDHRDRAWTGIDLAAPPSFATYAEGRDPALEAALAYRAEPPLAELLTEAARTRGAAAAGEQLESWAADPRRRFADQEAALPAAALALTRARLVDAGLAAAQAAARRLPHSARAAIALGFAAEAAGEIELARSAAQRALAIDPDNREARSMRERLAR